MSSCLVLKSCHGGSHHPHSAEPHSAACLQYKTIILFILNVQYETDLHNWCIKAMYLSTADWYWIDKACCCLVSDFFWLLHFLLTRLSAGFWWSQTLHFVIHLQQIVNFSCHLEHQSKRCQSADTSSLFHTWPLDHLTNTGICWNNQIHCGTEWHHATQSVHLQENASFYDC